MPLPLREAHPSIRESILTLHRPLLAARLSILAWAASLFLDPASVAAQSSDALLFVPVEEGPHVNDPTSSGGALWLDADGDGDPDLFVPGGYDVSGSDPVPFPNRLYLNDGRGGFVVARASRLHEDQGYSSGPSAADIDNDGDPDLLVGNQQRGEEFLYRNDGSGEFTRVVDSAVASLGGGSTYVTSFGDVDNDGWVDALVVNGGLSGAGRSWLLRNRGDGRFETWPGDVSADSTFGFGATFVDIDSDGDVDLHVLPERLFRNEGGRLGKVEGPLASSRPHFNYPSGAAWGDYDNDGDFDVYVVYPGGAINDLFRNDGDWRFTQVVEGWPVLDGAYSTSAAWADLDNDADLDLVVANWGAPHQVFLNRGDGTFERPRYLEPEPGFASGAGIADVEGDGDLDIYVAHWSNRAGELDRNRLYRNDTPATGNWLRIDLEGTRSNRSALGARVVVTADVAGRRVVQTREVRAMEGWRSQHEATAHFGLGDAQEVARIEVRWPSGMVTILQDVQVNRRLRLVEGRDRQGG